MSFQKLKFPKNRMDKGFQAISGFHVYFLYQAEVAEKLVQ
jgi:hypothetical protein